MSSARRGIVIALAFAGTATILASPARADDDAGIGCLEAHESSVKLRRANKLREAETQLVRCASESCSLHVREECAARLEEVKATLPSIVFAVDDGRGNDLGDVVVSADGERLADHLDGTAIVMNPGEHVFVFDAAAGRRAERRFILRAGERNRRERIVLAPAPAAMTSASAPVQVAPAHSSPPSSLASGGWTAQKTVSAILGGAGVIAIGTGLAFGIAARSDWLRAQDECRSSLECQDHAGAVQDRQAAGAAASAATVLVGVGLAAAAVGAVLWIVAPSKNGVAPRASARAGGNVGWSF